MTEARAFASMSRSWLGPVCVGASDQVEVLDAGRGWQAFEAFSRGHAAHDRTGVGRRSAIAEPGRMLKTAGGLRNLLLRKNDCRSCAPFGPRPAVGLRAATIENLVIDFVSTIIQRSRLRPTSSDSQPSSRISGASLGSARSRPALMSTTCPPGTCTADRKGGAEAIHRVRQALPAGYYAEPAAMAKMVDLSAAEDRGRGRVGL